MDLRFAIRSLRKNPGFTFAAVAAMTLGIGANTAIFSVVNTVLLRPLAYPDPDRIVQFVMTWPGGSGARASATKFAIWRQQTSAFEDVAAYDEGGPGLNVTGGAYPEQIHGMHVSAAYFRLFGAPVAHGRTFTEDEDRPNGGHVVVLSDGFWKRHFGGDPRIAGKTISLSGEPHTIVGIVGPGFDTENDPPPDVWLPFQLDPNSSDQAHYFVAAGRLKPGVTLGMANAQLQLAAGEFRRKFVGVLGPRDGFGVQPIKDIIVGDVRSSLLVLAGAVILVLLIACANVANLLLVRATGRKREIAIRAAVGAGRGRIVRQLLTESLVLSTIGGVLGLGLGIVGVRALLAINPGDIPRIIPRIGEHGAALTVDWRVLAFTVAVSLITGVLFGLTPAINASRADLSTMLKESSGRSGTGFRQNKARSLVVVSETALALILLIGAALLIRTFIALRAVNPGFDSHNVLTMRMSLDGSRFANTAGLTRLAGDGVTRIKALPGVVAAAAGSTLPLEAQSGLPFTIVGRPLVNGPSLGVRVGWMSASPGYFDVFKIPLIRGRVFTDRDDGGASRVVVINQTMARQFWPKGDPLDDRVLIGKGYGPEFADPARQIIGIVGDVRDDALNRNPEPMMYVPVAQVPDGVTALFARIEPTAWMVRSRVEPHSLTSAIENELRQASGGLPVARVRAMDEIVARSTARPDFNMSLLTIFGCSALLLAAIGIYGLMAYTVQQRTQEIGIRMALGAGRKSVRNMVVLEGMRLALSGVAIGMACAFGLARFLASFLFGVQARDPVVFAAVPILLSAVALLAVWLPARGATRIDPVDALRWE